MDHGGCRHLTCSQLELELLPGRSPLTGDEPRADHGSDNDDGQRRRQTDARADGDEQADLDDRHDQERDQQQGTRSH